MDTYFAKLLYACREPALVDFFLFVTVLGRAKFTFVAAAIVTVILFLWRERRLVIPLWILVGGSYLSVFILKILFHRQRPQGLGVYSEVSYSFPSLHSTIAVALYGFIAFVLTIRTESKSLRLFIIITTITLVCAIGFSRLYLGVHFPSDVLGGYLLGALWLAVGIRLSKSPLAKKTDESR